MQQGKQCFWIACMEKLLILVPQFEETDVRIDAISPQCIELVVKPPSYPGGTLTTFTVR